MHPLVELILITWRDTLLEVGKSNFRQITDRLKSESGQSIVLVAVVIMSFMMFFMFALNTGLLINAKISVQAAADAAAYAGAATQGRQLNAISFLNYDMRRQYKKFVFRYDFVGSMGSPNFPTNSTGSAPSPDYDFPKFDYSNPPPSGAPPGSGTLYAVKVPVVCIPLTVAGNANDNCMFLNQPSTVASLPANTMNPVIKALADQLNNIQATQAAICDAQGSINLFVVIAWLFRGGMDPSELNTMISTLNASFSVTHPGSPPLNPTDVQRAADTISTLVQGLGLYPRNIIDLMRIETLVGFLNDKHTADIDRDMIESWEKSGAAESKERSIQAFKSAATNLNNDIFDASKTQMTEMQGDNQISIEPVKINFNVYVSQANSAGLTGGQTICNSKIDPFPVIGAPVGVKLTSDAHVNYAVRLKAFVKPRGLLFLPGSDALELDAVAAAKPFGSRIGPRKITQDDLTKKIQPNPVPASSTTAFNCSGTPSDCYVPYFQIAASKYTFDKGYLSELKANAMSGGAFNMAGIQTAQQLAIAPNPQEVGHYNIIPPPKGTDEMAYEFINYGTEPGIYKFYAPIFPQGSGDPLTKVDQFLGQVFPLTSVGPTTGIGIDMATTRATVAASIKNYIQTNLSTGRGTENGETETLAAIELPLSDKTGKPIAQSTGGNWLTTSKQVLSSWGPDSVRLKGDYGFTPRFGYSVKFVTVRDLKAQGLASDDDDIDKIEH